MSNIIDLQYLFTPGTGAIPPYLAGRQREQDYFQNRVKALISRKPISQDIILYGPRGNGKTALLRHLQKETIEKERSKLDILWVTPKELEHPGRFVDLVIGDNSSLRRKITSGGFSVNLGIAQANVEIDLSRRTLTIRDLLQERCQEKPQILIIDEAHRLGANMGEELLNASQNLRTEGSPFLLILAGTPNLRAVLARANASFWERSEKMPLGRLSLEEARQAITVPLEKAGISFVPGVAEEIVERAHCYPFFLQIWGDQLAQRLDQTGGTEIIMDAVQEVSATVVSKRDSMYQDRFDEIKRMGLLPVAQRVAEAFIQTGEPHLHESVLDEAIGGGMAGEDESIMEKLDQLMQLGYVWRVGGLDYEPGIPSLMTFVQRYSLPKARRETARPDKQNDEKQS